MTKISNLYSLTNYITANSSGNVVIAAPASGYALDVTGTGRFTGSLQSASLLVNGTTVTDGHLVNIIGNQATNGNIGIVLNNTNSTYARIYALTNVNGNLVVYDYTSNSQRVTITSGGEVGIGVIPTSGNRFWVKGSDSTSNNTSLITQNAAGTITFLVRNDGLAYFQGGNVGIGVTTPQERFEIAGLNGNIRLYGRSGISQNTLSSNIYYNGTIWTRDNLSYGAQVLRMDVTNGFFYIDADTTTSGYPATRLTINASNGNVGIGTTSPNSSLAISISAFSNAGLKSYTTDNVGGISAYVNSQDPYTGYLDIYATRSGDGGTLGGSVIRFLTHSTSTTPLAVEKMRLTSEGNLLLTSGTTVYNTSGDFYLRAGTSGALVLGSGGTNNYLRITSGGQIAIGTSNPQSGNNIQINSISPIFALYSGQTDTTTNLVYSTLMFKSYAGLYNQQFQQPDAQIQIVRGNHSYNGHQSTHDADMVFSTNDNVNGAGVSERMRITSIGPIKAQGNSGLIVDGNSYTHEFNASQANDVALTIRQTSATNPYGFSFGFQNADPNNSSNFIFRAWSYSSGTQLYVIYSNGTTAGRSDIRLKKNIETARDGYLEDLCKLRLVKYNWYNNEEGTPKELGLIAQEVEEVFPGLVSTQPCIKVRDVEQEDGTIKQEEYEDGDSKVLKNSVFPYITMKALQELTAKVEELSAKVTALESK